MKYNIAVLDDYQNVAMSLADWTTIQARATVTVFNYHLGDTEQLIATLLDFDVLCVMRERTPLPAEVLDRLPRLKLIVSTGSGNTSIDTQAAQRHGIILLYTGYFPTPTVELTWALILASAKQLVTENSSVRSGGWQTTVGTPLHQRTLGLLGVGNIGGQVAKVGLAFGMRVIGWSPNLTADRAAASGVRLVTKEELFAQADILSIHLVLGQRSRDIVGAVELALMKPTAHLVNTSRGPLIDEAALIHVLEENLIAGAALDVFDEEPLPRHHVFRNLPNVLATPHIGYVSEDLYRTFYGDTVKNVALWLRTAPWSLASDTPTEAPHAPEPMHSSSAYIQT